MNTAISLFPALRMNLVFAAENSESGVWRHHPRARAGQTTRNKQPIGDHPHTETWCLRSKDISGSSMVWQLTDRELAELAPRQEEPRVKKCARVAEDWNVAKAQSSVCIGPWTTGSLIATPGRTTFGATLVCVAGAAPSQGEVRFLAQP